MCVYPQPNCSTPSAWRFMADSEITHWLCCRGRRSAAAENARDAKRRQITQEANGLNSRGRGSHTTDIGDISTREASTSMNTSKEWSVHTDSTCCFRTPPSSIVADMFGGIVPAVLEESVHALLS